MKSKKVLTKTLSALLVLVMVISLIPVGVISALASTSTYNPDAAVSYAKSHCATDVNSGTGECINVGAGDNPWWCAEFIYNCLKAGGFTISGYTAQVNAKAQGEYLQEYGKRINGTISGNNVNNSHFDSPLQKGDVVFVVYDNSVSSSGHVLLYSGETTSDGSLKFYAHNSLKNNETYKLSGNYLTAATEIYAVRLNGSIETNTNTSKALYNLSWPVPTSSAAIGKITSAFGPRTAPTAGASTNHRGIDIGVPIGTPVYSAADGVVVLVSSSNARGNYVLIYHEGLGLSTLYQHLKSATVKAGDTVKYGSQVAISGNTGVGSGPHLHFGVMKGKATKADHDQPSHNMAIDPLGSNISYNGKIPSKNPNNYPVLERDLVYQSGSAVKTGDDVKWLQCVLLHLGYSIDIDGSYGPSCKSIVEKFQSAYGLTVDGQVGPNTRAKLKEVWGSKGHTWGSGTVTKNATCTATGSKTYKCSYCEATKTETIPVTSHTYGSWQSADGSNHKRTCSACSAYQTASHTWNSGVITKNATCTASGVKTYTCTECNATKTETIPVTGHNFGSWQNYNSSNHIRYCSNCGVGEQGTHAWNSGVVTKNATCKEAGVKTYTCSVCSTTKTETIPTILHVYGDWKYEDLGCHKRMCACGDYQIDSHSWNDGVVVKTPTCAESGMIVYTCSVCKYEFKDYYNSVTEHAWNSGVVTKSANCTESGIKTYTCTICSTTKTETIAATGHSYGGSWKNCTSATHIRYCANCGVGEQENHSWDNGVITKDSTCLVIGVKTYTCTGCSATKTETIKTKVHSWNDGEITKNPTCNESGLKIYTCTSCNSTKEERIPIIVTAHSFGAWEYSDASNHKRTCSYCFSYQTATHTWDEGKITKEPTVEYEGEMTYTCTVCKGTKTGKLDKLEPIEPPIEDEPIIDSNTPTVTVESTNGFVGGTVDITVSIKNNPGIWSMAVDMPIDTDIFEFVSADISDSVFDSIASSAYDKSTNSYKFNGYYSDYFNDITENGAVFVISLKIKEDVECGEYELAIKLLENQIVNSNEENVKFYSVNGSVTVMDYMVGDVNGDGYVTNADVLRIFRYIYNSELYPLEFLEAGDVNGDGYVTNADVLRIFRYIYNSELYPLS